jgi:hypothetical protein
LVLAVAHLLLVLSTNVTQAASFAIAGSLHGAICLPDGGGGSLDGQAPPAHDHRDDCCVLCGAVGPIAAVPPALGSATIYPVPSDEADRSYAVPFPSNRFGSLSGSPRAPPDIA